MSSKTKQKTKKLKKQTVRKESPRSANKLYFPYGLRHQYLMERQKYMLKRINV